MNENGLLPVRSPSLRFEQTLALIFALLGALFTALIAAHWFLVLEPTLRAEAETRAQALAQAQTKGIERLLGSDLPPESLADEVKTVLDGMLLLKDQTTGAPFIRQISLVLDYELFDAPAGLLDMVRGARHCEDCFVARVPLYHPRDRLLIGILTFQSSPQFLHRVVHDIRGKLLWGGGTMLCLIGLAWLGASVLLRRLGASEANLRDVFEAAPFPMVLNEHGRIGLTQANRAAMTYLRLEEDESGYLNSDIWLGLYAAGFPSKARESREVMIPAVDGTQRWALVSAMPLSYSGAPSHLISLADVTEMKKIENKLRSVSYTDGLTGLYNRRYLYLMLNKELDLVKRYGNRLSIILLDLDHFKNVNDSYGHRVGDEVLARAADILKSCVREVDVAGRYGGEEFLVILPNSGIHDAMEAAERIRVQIKEEAWPRKGLGLTVSCGVCEYAHTDVDEFVETADRRLYQAKQTGRDRVVGEGLLE